MVRPGKFCGAKKVMDWKDLDYSEKMISTLPVVVRRRVKFGECDPAGVVYTPVFAEYVLSGFQWFIGVMLGGPMWQELTRAGFDTPIKALTFEFRSMLVTDQVFDMACRVTEIRTRTFDLEVLGRSVTESPHDLFVGKVTPIMVSRDDKKSIEIPTALRRKIEQYRSAIENSQ
jgi:acyl-CoA thioester hydrolase